MSILRDFITFAPVKLKNQVSMCQLQVQVFMNEQTFASNKRLYERIVTINDACSIPFETISKTMQFLYGPKIIINFKLSLS